MLQMRGKWTYILGGNSVNEFYSTWSLRVLSVLRIVAGFLMIWHGNQKLFGYPISLPPGAEGALVTTAGIIELFGGLLILIGLFTRPVAFLISGLMAAAYFLAHAPSGFLPIVNQGELAAIYSFLYLYFAFAGGGAWSLDTLLSRSTGRRVLTSETT
jgi:putative oxidoreductase